MVKPKKKEAKKERRKIKPLNTGKKKVAFILFLVGILIFVLGMALPIIYWPSQNAYSGADLDADMTEGPGFVLYSNFDRDDNLKVHDTVVSVKPFHSILYIDGVTYTEITRPGSNPQPIGDTFLVEVQNSQYFVVPGLSEPDIKAGDSILADCKIKEIKGKDGAGNDVLREIAYSTKADIEQNSMDGVFFGLGMFGLILFIIGLIMWITFMLQPEEKPPAYVDIHEAKKREFIDGVRTTQQSKAYPCPICGINLTYKEELGKWYCEICNKLM